jgi:hypothetical protein
MLGLRQTKQALCANAANSGLRPEDCGVATRQKTANLCTDIDAVSCRVIIELLTAIEALKRTVLLEATLIVRLRYEITR